jgi:antitoxin component YwqK of YwqJK toxin-antitoxin module
MSLLLLACSGSSPTARSASDALKSLPDDVLTQVDLSMLPKSEGRGRFDDALSAVTGVVLGMRRIDDGCGSYLDVRMFPEVHLGGRDASEPRDTEEFAEERALLALPNSKGTCGEPAARLFQTNQIQAGDRVVFVLGAAVNQTRDTPQWKRKPRVLAIAPLAALPEVVVALPPARFAAEGEQYLPVPRMPAVGTPASLRLLGSKNRFEVQGEEITDRALGIVWQRDEAKYQMSIEEAGLYCETQRTGGHTDWRLPTALEMHGLFSPSIPPPAVVDLKLFPAPKDELFWTRTDDDGAWVGLPYEGILISTHYDDPSPYGNYHVRCVRSGNARVTEMMDRIAFKDEMLLDASSGLSWHLGKQKEPVTQDVAKKYCDQGTFGGFDDWHLPSPEEAFSIMSACPERLQSWEGEPDEVWTSMVDSERHVGGTFDVCNMYRSVPLAAIFEKEGIDPKNPLARVMCTRTTSFEPPPGPKPCFVGAELKNAESSAICEEKGVRHGPYRSSWPSGGVFEIANYDHGVRSGMSVLYHENGNIYSRMDYVKGKLSGEVWAKRPTGTFLFKGRYENGLPTGRWISFDAQGREIEFIDMSEGKPGSGRYVRYGDEGEKLIECPTLGGWEHGILRVFDRNGGQPIGESTYRSGWQDGPSKTLDGKGGQSGQVHRDEREGLWVTRNREGIIVFTQSWRQGQLDGVQETFDDQGKLLSSVRIRHGFHVGNWESKSSDGSIETRGEIDEEGTGKITTYSSGDVLREELYLRGKKHGVWSTYDGPKKLSSREEYQDDFLVSDTDWYESGQIRSKRNYVRGRLHGLAEEFDLQGALRQRGKYENGMREGHWQFMSMRGRRFEVEFVKGKAVKISEGTGGR